MQSVVQPVSLEDTSPGIPSDVKPHVVLPISATRMWALDVCGQLVNQLNFSMPMVYFTISNDLGHSQVIRKGLIFTELVSVTWSACSGYRSLSFAIQTRPSAYNRACQWTWEGEHRPEYKTKAGI